MLNRDGFWLLEKYWLEDESELKATAAVDLSCAYEQLNIRVRSLNQDVKTANRVGVTGCGRSAIYFKALSRGATWALASPVEPAKP